VVNYAARDLRAGRDDGACAAGESPLGNLIADAYRHVTGARFAFVNPGGIRAMLPAGAVTWGDLFSAQPAENDLVTVDLTGAEIWQLLGQQNNHHFKRNLELSGLHYTYRLGPSGEGSIEAVYEGRVGDHGRPVPPDDGLLYPVVVNEFLAAGGDHYSVLCQGRNRCHRMKELEALATYIAGLPRGFDSAIEGRITQR
jgi:5'-nucleotidase